MHVPGFVMQRDRLLYTIDFASRNPSGAWKQIGTRYRPQDTAAISKIRCAMQRAINRLEPQGDPLALLVKLENSRVGLGELGEPWGRSRFFWTSSAVIRASINRKTASRKRTSDCC